VKSSHWMTPYSTLLGNSGTEPAVVAGLLSFIGADYASRKALTALFCVRMT